MIKSFKIRLFPTKAQEELMWKHVGCSRFIYNYMLEKQNESYVSGSGYISHYAMIKMVTPLKHDGEHDWLNEVASTTLQIICGDVNNAYTRLFRGIAQRTKFKSRKRAKASFPIDAEKMWFDDQGFVHVLKIHKIRYKTNYVLQTGTGIKYTNPRISCVNGKWILSFGMECENQAFDLNDFSVGIDLGIKDSAVVAYNNQKLVFHNINKSRTIRLIKKKIKALQRSISRKYEANKVGNRYVKTKNIERLENQLRKLYARLSNIRSNFIHQSTHTIVSLNPKRVVMEGLNVKGMMKNRYLAKAIQEQPLYEWIRQMRYKCEWRNIDFVQVSRWYPSSKTCHACGCVKRNLMLSERTFICPECGYTEDRDYNAALNLMSYGD